MVSSAGFAPSFLSSLTQGRGVRGTMREATPVSTLLLPATTTCILKRGAEHRLYYLLPWCKMIAFWTEDIKIVLFFIFFFPFFFPVWVAHPALRTERCIVWLCPALLSSSPAHRLLCGDQLHAIEKRRKKKERRKKEEKLALDSFFRWKMRKALYTLWLCLKWAPLHS